MVKAEVVKSQSKDMQIKSKTEEVEVKESVQKRKRGRPKKQRTPEEIAKLEEAKKNKLTLEQKQEIKLKLQQDRVAKKAAAGSSPDAEDRCYCKNKDLHLHLLGWRNSDANGFRVLKMVNDKLVQTSVDNSQEQHEKYEDGMRYFVKIPKMIEKFQFKALPKLPKEALQKWQSDYFTAIHAKVKSQLEELVKNGTQKEPKLYSESRDYIIHEVTYFVKKEGWAFDFDVVEERKITNEIGEMLLKIGRKLLNHSNFRNYDVELKNDMLMYGVQKIIKGLKNYNFKFSNPFAWITQGYWNSYLTSIYKHYKQLNIKKDLMKKLSMELETYNGMDPRSSLNRAIKSYLGEEFADD